MHDLYAVTGAALFGTAAGRVAHALDLRGPTMAVDAACSGSLLAVHLACASIRSGESEMALVSGVNLQMGTAFTSALTTGRVISPLGQCRFGDRDANGYVRSDGALAVLLKPLHAALADGDRVYATILGSGTSSVGRAARSIVAPSAPAQVAAITAAHAQAGISPTEVGYVEAHGTGTTKGDHAELTAFGSVFRPPPGTDEPCLVGSAKSNVGHTEAAAGLVGLIKAALAIQHGVIPPTLHVDTPNPLLATEARHVELPREVRAWPARGGRRIAGVNACGMSGTNVHVVLAEAPIPHQHARAERRPETLVVPVSARSPEALVELTAAFADRVANTATDEELRDVVHSAGARRTHYGYRVAVAGSTREQLADGLRTAVADQPADAPRVVFVCPGLDVPWGEVGLPFELPAFGRRVEECDKALQEHLGWSVLDRLTRPDPLAGDTRDTLPVLWAVQMGLAAVWEDFGVEPDAVLGHGAGKLAAATIRGSESIREAAAIVSGCAATVDWEQFASFSTVSGRALHVELGPESGAVTGMAVPSLRTGEPASHTVLTGLAAAYTGGVEVDWAAVQPGRYVSLPGYPWQRRRYWIDDEEMHSVPAFQHST
jgi:acyl transferase domain-containing protein